MTSVWNTDILQCSGTNYFFFPKKKLTNFFGTVEKVFLFFFCESGDFFLPSRIMCLRFVFVFVFSHFIFGHERCKPSSIFFFWRIVPFSSHGPYAEKGEDKIGIGLISDTVVQTVLLDIHIIGPKYRSVSLLKPHQTRFTFILPLF